MAEYNPFKVLSVACPKCGSEGGVNCVTSTGGKAESFHTARKAVVYSSYQPGLGKPTGPEGPKTATQASVRTRLRKAVIDKAIAWSGVESAYDSKVQPQRERALVQACLDLAHHRRNYPELRG